MEEAPKARWVVVWSTEHASGELGPYGSEAEAETAAEDWFTDMVAADDCPAQAADEYSWEIAFLDPERDEDEEGKDEPGISPDEAKARLEQKLQAIAPEGYEASVYYWNSEGEAPYGIRIAEISYSNERGGASWMQSDPGGSEIIFAAERYLLDLILGSENGADPQCSLYLLRHALYEVDLWYRDEVQFARLICEIVANVDMDVLDFKAIAESMDLSEKDLQGLFDRANNSWENVKRGGTPPNPQPRGVAS
jgi:hypothetical protein